MKWTDLLSATHGTQLNDQGQIDAWEHVIKSSVPDLKKGEIEKALRESMQRGEQTAGFRVTANDVVQWIVKSRIGWVERKIRKGNRVYFPDRPRICGQMQSRNDP